MGNVVCWSGVTPKSKWREPECHHVCREFLSLMLLFSPLSCAPSLDLEKTELSHCTCLFGALVDGNSLFDKHHSSRRDLEEDALNNR